MMCQVKYKTDKGEFLDDVELFLDNGLFSHQITETLTRRYGKIQSYEIVKWYS